MKTDLVESVSSLGRNAPGGNRIAAKRSPLIVGFPVVIEALLMVAGRLLCLQYDEALSQTRDCKTPFFVASPR